MNTLVSQGKALAEELNAFMKTYDMPANKTVIIGTPFTHLSTCVAAVDTKKIHVSAQNCSQRPPLRLGPYCAAFWRART